MPWRTLAGMLVAAALAAAGCADETIARASKGAPSQWRLSTTTLRSSPGARWMLARGDSTYVAIELRSDRTLTVLDLVGVESTDAQERRALPAGFELGSLRFVGGSYFALGTSCAGAEPCRAELLESSETASGWTVVNLPEAFDAESSTIDVGEFDGRYFVSTGNPRPLLYVRNDGGRGWDAIDTPAKAEGLGLARCSTKGNVYAFSSRAASGQPGAAWRVWALDGDRSWVAASVPIVTDRADPRFGSSGTLCSRGAFVVPGTSETTALELEGSKLIERELDIAPFPPDGSDQPFPPLALARTVTAVITGSGLERIADLSTVSTLLASAERGDRLSALVELDDGRLALLTEE